VVVDEERDDFDCQGGRGQETVTKDFPFILNGGMSVDGKPHPKTFFSQRKNCGNFVTFDL